MRGGIAARLVRPSTQHEHSHASFIAEVLDFGEELVPWVLADVGDNFEEYVARLEQQSRSVNLPPGFVPSSTFWLLDMADEIVAVSNLRHALTESLLSFGGHVGFGVRPSARRRGYGTEALRQTLFEARKLKIEDVLVTCDKGNIGSAKAILANGGEFAGEGYIEAHSSVVQRYWIHRS
jgi:predicted acetyltransferase